MIAISLMILTDDESLAVKAGEVLSRTATGLALEGIAVSVNYATVADEEEK